MGKFSHEDLSAIKKSPQFLRAVREERCYLKKMRQSNLIMENNLPTRDGKLWKNITRMVHVLETAMGAASNAPFI